MSKKIGEEEIKLAKASLKNKLNKIVTCWEEEKGCLLENDRKRIKTLKKNLFTLSKDLNTEIGKKKKFLSQEIVAEAEEIANGFLKLSIEIKRKMKIDVNVYKDVV
jgi:hypothetical protein